MHCVERSKYKKRKRKVKFWRCRLPCHCVLLCYSRIGNRPPSKRVVIQKRLNKRRFKQKMRQKWYQIFKDKALYEEWSSGPSPTFLLECPDISLAESMLLRLGQGGIKDDFEHFALEFRNSGSDVESVRALVARTQVSGR